MGLCPEGKSSTLGAAIISLEYCDLENILYISLEYYISLNSYNNKLYIGL